MTPEEQDLCESSEKTIAAMLEAGRSQGHALNSWTDEIEHHALKAMGHLASAEKMRRGVAPEDTEGLIGHLQRALCRSAMALYCAKAASETKVDPRPQPFQSVPPRTPTQSLAAGLSSIPSRKY